MKLLAIDPGGTNGVALLGWEPFEIFGLKQVGYNDLMDYLLDSKDIDHVVIEDFRIRAGKQTSFIGSRMETIKAIGQIEMWAKTRSIPYNLQAPDKKSLGSKYSNVKPPKNHADSHQIDAYNHGIFFLVSTGKIKISDLSIK